MVDDGPAAGQVEATCRSDRRKAPDGGRRDLDVPMTPWLLAPLAALGGLLSLYFTAVTYGWMEPDSRMVPRLCRMDEGTCRRVVHAPEARVFGLPNSLLGLGYYAAVLTWLVSRPWPPFWASALAAGALWTVFAGAWLSWALLVRLRTPCPLCFVAHGVNLVLAAAIVGIVLAS